MSASPLPLLMPVIEPEPVLVPVLVPVAVLVLVLVLAPVAVLVLVELVWESVFGVGISDAVLAGCSVSFALLVGWEAAKA